MTRYKSTEQVLAEPMTRLEYSTLRGWKLPEDADGSDSGFLVESVTQLEFSQRNHPDYTGYIRWMHTSLFQDSFTRMKAGEQE